MEQLSRNTARLVIRWFFPNSQESSSKSNFV
jgi:hypothetical protein